MALLNLTEKEKADVLKRFMQEFFPYAEFRKAGVFTKEMRNDYEAQAKHICNHLSLKSIYEYGSEEIRCHITYADPKCPAGMATYRPLIDDGNGNLIPEPFVTVIPSIWD